MAAEKKVEARGLLNLANLVAASQGLVRTDLPMAYAPLIFEMVSRADLGKRSGPSSARGRTRRRSAGSATS